MIRTPVRPQAVRGYWRGAPTTRRADKRWATITRLMGFVVVSLLLAGTTWAQGTPDESARRFVLVGVVFGRSGGPMAALKDSRTGREDLYHVGDQIQDVTLLAVATDRAVLRSRGQDVELRLATSPRGSDPTPPPRQAIRGRALPGRGPTGVPLPR